MNICHVTIRDTLRAVIERAESRGEVDRVAATKETLRKLPPQAAPRQGVPTDRD